MRKHNILINRNRHSVKLLRIDKGLPFLVEVDDKVYKVELLNEFNYGTPVSMRIGGKPYRVELEEVNKSKPFSVEVNGKSFMAEYEVMSKSQPKIIEKTVPAILRRPTAKLTAESVVTASMPGRVVLLKVEVGDSVKEGDTLCVLEAMKMENEIAAPMPGVVKEIRVSEGAGVDRGDALVLIK